ncbi:hypothetical protein ElyMa_003436300 [Elysia marginata]|uniref:Uncharacterized protein n=1 Tax=Elysia marginata TaxID=1093978 RepID=A0AAV4JXF0_9GAST|nr:hypothetical protein ElyMa_003436300 [Elysia marginata]
MLTLINSVASSFVPSRLNATLIPPPGPTNQDAVAFKGFQSHNPSAHPVTGSTSLSEGDTYDSNCQRPDVADRKQTTGNRNVTRKRNP